MPKRTDLDKDGRICREVRRLKKIYRVLSKDEKAFVDGLIKRAAYLQVTLEDMESDLDANGRTEMFTQSSNTPAYERERPTSRRYISLCKNYSVLMKQLADFVIRTPVEPAEDKEDELDSFLKESE